MQENPDYSVDKPVTRVKPGSTIMIQTITNNHAQEWKTRPSGHYTVYLAGKSGTQLTTLNQLTIDRAVFKAPENKYSHIVDYPDGTHYDPNTAFIPFKLVDPTGAYLSEGTYNFVWTWWWASGTGADGKDYTIPSYTSSFDVVIDQRAQDSGYLTDCINTMGDLGCSEYLVGNSSAPGSKDTHSPFPPFTQDYLTSGYNGDGAGPDETRSFQPYWTSFVDATEAPPLRENVDIPHVKDLDDTYLQEAIPLPPGSKFPNGTDLIRMPTMVSSRSPVPPSSYPIPLRPLLTVTNQNDKLYTSMPSAPDQSGMPLTSPYNPMKIPGSFGGPIASPITDRQALGVYAGNVSAPYALPATPFKAESGAAPLSSHGPVASSLRSSTAASVMAASSSAMAEMPGASATKGARAVAASASASSSGATALPTTMVSATGTAKKTRTEGLGTVSSSAAHSSSTGAAAAAATTGPAVPTKGSMGDYGVGYGAAAAAGSEAMGTKVGKKTACRRKRHGKGVKV